MYLYIYIYYTVFHRGDTRKHESWKRDVTHRDENWLMELRHDGVRGHVTMGQWARCLAYGVATIRRLLKIIGLFCKRALYKRLYPAKETYNFKEPTHRSHPIVDIGET